jgi:hypothetical protein
MSRRVSPSAKRSYGVQRVTRVWDTSRATLYRHRGQGDEPRSRRRPGPVGPMPDPALVEAIRALLAATARSTARAIARSGRDCALPAFALPSGACCA